MSLIHAPVSVAYRGHAMRICCFLQDSAESLVRLTLRYQSEGKSYERRMLPVDSYVAEDSYSLYAATVPAAHMVGKLLIYSFCEEGNGREYTVPLQDADGEIGEEVPALLPLDLPERFYLASGDLSLHVAALGAPLLQMKLCVLTEGGTLELPAAPDEQGDFAVTLPSELLIRHTGKLRFFLEGSAAQYTARLGNERSPLSLRLVDNAGPTVCAHSPFEGERIPIGKAVTLNATFFDGSGVNLRTSVFCLDGKNLSQEAAWEEERVVYTPKRPLSRGEHVMELTLRDKRGNRTYHRVRFSVGEREEKKRRGGFLHTPRVALKALSAVKVLFGNKDK